MQTFFLVPRRLNRCLVISRQEIITLFPGHETFLYLAQIVVVVFVALLKSARVVFVLVSPDCVPAGAGGRNLFVVFFVLAADLLANLPQALVLLFHFSLEGVYCVLGP